MDNGDKDVDLENFFKSEETPAEGASALKGENNGQPNASEGVRTPAEEEARGERENARVRDLVDALKGRDEIIKELVQKQRSKSSNELSADENIDSFVEKIEDEPTRKLLKDYGDVLKKTIAKEFTPRLEKVKEMEFDKEFGAMAEKFPQLELFREEAKKSFKTNPNVSVKSIVGEMVLENSLTKPKPIEGNAGIAKRERIDINSASKEELYELLEEMKE